uniref:Uncharacterized protein n=1 Tax=Panagrolaimus sp. JU765 TaxID=591449 RepID=A0AC34RJA4_9BILA
MDNGGIAFFNKVPVPANVIRGSGKLTWLSSKAGLIAANRPSQCTVSFQLKDFCDQGVTDLTTVLRPGFLLSFQALPSETNDWIANFVSPLLDPDINAECKDNKEIDLELGDPAAANNTRDPYSMDLETQSVGYLLSLFVQCRMNAIPLSNLHSRISNSGNDELYRYIGSSSLKRRQFIERRSYIFGITENDQVYLQPPEIYSTVCMLAGFLLRRGGAGQSDAIFSFFHSATPISNLMKDSIGMHRGRFVDFFTRHPFVFAPFPAKFYVAVRRNIPYFDYNLFIKKHFPIYSSPSIQKQISYANTSSVALAMQFATNQFGQNVGIGGMEDSLSSGNRTPTATSWLGNETPLSSAATTNPPLSAGLTNSSRPTPLMHTMLSGTNSNEFVHRNEIFSNPSPPLADFKRMMIDVSTQASNDVGIGINPGCVCKCNCGARSNNLRDANGFIPFVNDTPPFSMMSNSPTSDMMPPGFNNDKFFSRPVKTDGTFNAAPGAPVSRTSSSQTPVEEPERVFDPFAFQITPFELKYRSLKL